MSGLLGNRQTLIVEGGDDAVILQKLSGVLERAGKQALSDRIYLWPAEGASQTPMYAGFVIGNKLDAAVLLDSDKAGADAKKKINELYLRDLADGTKFRIFMIGEAAGIAKNESSIEDLFPDEFYLDCVNGAYHVAITSSELPVDGSSMITKRVEGVLRQRYGRDKLDKGMIMAELLKRFDTWTDISKLPGGTAQAAETLFQRSILPSLRLCFTAGLPKRSRQRRNSRGALCADHRNWSVLGGKIRRRRMIAFEHRVQCFDWLASPSFRR